MFPLSSNVVAADRPSVGGSKPLTETWRAAFQPGFASPVRYPASSSLHYEAALLAAQSLAATHASAGRRAAPLALREPGQPCPPLCEGGRPFPESAVESSSSQLEIHRSLCPEPRLQNHSGKLMFHVIGAMAEFERALIQVR